MPPVRKKAIKKRHTRGSGLEASKHQRTTPAAISEVLSSSPEESSGTKTDAQDTLPNLADVALSSGTNVDAPSATQTEEMVDITSLSLGPALGATLAGPLDIDYSEP